MKNSLDLIIVIIGIVLAEIGGVGMIRQSPKLRNPLKIRMLGWIVSILGIVALVIIVIGALFGAWS